MCYRNNFCYLGLIFTRPILIPVTKKKTGTYGYILPDIRCTRIIFIILITLILIVLLQTWRLDKILVQKSLIKKTRMDFLITCMKIRLLNMALLKEKNFVMLCRALPGRWCI